MNIINQAIDCGVEKVIALSTDKAANPINLYGATKLCSDKLFVAGNAYVGARGHPTFSVVPVWECAGKQGQRDPPMEKNASGRRHDIACHRPAHDALLDSLEKSVDFLVQCFSLARGGKIFVPKSPA